MHQRSNACIAARRIITTDAVEVQRAFQSNETRKDSGATRMEELTASASMGHLHAHVARLVSIYMPAPYVSRKITALSAALFDELFPIVTRLKWTA
jgi:hypothetical protein